ncbi:MAG TPA: hypothetical protein VE760_08835 [Acidimicrobiales bacterium]|nr:hypothetical protein [Acidimicrobiales bacterium]
MEERGSAGSAAGTGGFRRRGVPWRAFLVGLALVLGWSLPSSVGAAQTPGAQTRACSRLQAALARVGNRGSAAQALTSRLQRLGCTTTGPTSTFGPTSTTVQATTTSVVVVDCPLPGGGVGPCPSTTVASSSTVPGATTSSVPGGATTSSIFAPTTVVGGPTTSFLPPPSSVPCSTTTSAGPAITTIPCLP